MKQLVIIVLIVLVGVVVWVVTSPKDESSTSVAGNQTSSAPKGTSQGGGDQSSTGDIKTGESQPGDKQNAGTEKEEFFDDRPATEVYTNADLAFNAVQKAAEDYDDLVLEQFSDLGPGCSWCDSFYTMVKEAMLSPSLDPDKRSYFAEVLAVSGRLDNIKTLVESTKNAQDPDNADIFAEALELSILKDDSIEFLEQQFQSDNEILKEASIAAVTNQGTPLAVEALWEQTRKVKDPDGYYSLGIGLGEVIPDDSSLPLLQKYVQEKNEYSHLAVKALLNSGLPGLKLVFDSISGAPNPEGVKQLLKLDEALDHVAFEEDVQEFVNQTLANSKDENVRYFAQKIKEDFESEESEGGELEDEAVQ